jgi:molecular chaperone GrpE
MMVDRNEQNSRRIPIRFAADDTPSARDAEPEREEKAAEGDDPADLTPEEIGRTSSYEDETEVQRRIDRGMEEEGEPERERGDDADVAGGPPRGEVPEMSETRDAASESREAQAVPGDKRAQQRANSEAVGPTLAELIATRAELKRVEAVHDELQERLARRQADFENYRKRVERDRGETYNRMVGDVVSKLLPVLDNFRRALDAEASVQATESEEFRHFLQGVELIYKQLGDVLEGLGLEPVAAVGHPFDPHVHEAVITETTDDFEPDTVMQELVRGYRLGDKLLRPAMVKVATRE